jgi:hypothetical protein
VTANLLWHAVCSVELRVGNRSKLDFRTRGKAMQTFISGIRTLYAAIETRRGDGATERFVLAYTWEQSLRELVAAPSIVASGCLTREHAEEICRGEKPGRDRWRHQGCQVSGFNDLPRFALHYGVRSGIRTCWTMFLIFVDGCLQKSRFMWV